MGSPSIWWIRLGFEAAAIMWSGSECERSVKAMEQADLVLAVFDLPRPGREQMRSCCSGGDGQRRSSVGNKRDLVERSEIGR